jgi:hypothetical protein
MRLYGMCCVLPFLIPEEIESRLTTLSPLLLESLSNPVTLLAAWPGQVHEQA